MSGNSSMTETGCTVRAIPRANSKSPTRGTNLAENFVRPVSLPSRVGCRVTNRRVGLVVKLWSRTWVRSEIQFNNARAESSQKTPLPASGPAVVTKTGYDFRVSIFEFRSARTSSGSISARTCRCNASMDWSARTSLMRPGALRAMARYPARTRL